MKLDLPGPAGRLEARLEEPEGAPRAAAVVCHPHPLYGGTMQNTVVVRAARALVGEGVAALRFNFRGVEGSAGEHDGAGGEVEDARAALDGLAARFPGIELWAGGLSFGARTACALAAGEPRVARVVCIALPVRVFECDGVEALRQPGYFLFGSRDEFGTLADARARFGRLPAHLELDEIEGADHFFRGRTPQVEERIGAWARRSLARAGSPLADEPPSEP